MALKYNVFECENIGKVRMSQEDSHGMKMLTPNGDVFVLCDGMGGYAGGRQASSIGVKCILEYFQKEKQADPVKALDGAIQFANTQIIGYAAEHPELRGMGTTVCILLIQEEKVWLAHVGDSRIYLFLKTEQELHRISKDHSYVQSLVDSGQITDEEAENRPDRNKILKALGVNQHVCPSISEVPVLPKSGDIFLLCSDGLSDMVTDSVIERIMQNECSVEYKGKMLMDEALNNGGHDNVTIQLVAVSESPYTKTEFKSFNPKHRPQQKGDDSSRSPELPRNRKCRLSYFKEELSEELSDVVEYVRKFKKRISMAAALSVLLVGLGGAYLCNACSSHILLGSNVLKNLEDNKAALKDGKNRVDSMKVEIEFRDGIKVKLSESKKQYERLEKHHNRFLKTAWFAGKNKEKEVNSLWEKIEGLRLKNLFNEVESCIGSATESNR